MAWRKGSRGRKTYRRKYAYRRKAKKYGRVMFNIKKYLSSRAETKVYKTQLTYSVLNDRLAGTQPLGLIFRGTDQNQRVGESIRLVGIKVVYSFVPLASRWSGATRIRFMVVRGQAWAANVGLWSTLSAATEDMCWDKAAPRNGAEVWNSDMGALLMCQETVYPNLGIQATVLDPNEVPPTDNLMQVNNETTANGRRRKMWFSGKGRTVKWRTATDQYTFTESQPNLLVYASNLGSQMAYGTTLGTLYSTVHVYYKDM